MDSTKPLKPVSVTRTNIPAEEVARQYLKVELTKALPYVTDLDQIDRSIEELDQKQLWRMLEAISFTYRINGMFWIISNSGFAWNEERWNIADLTLGGVNPAVDKITHSKEVNKNPILFRDFLLDYFKKNIDSDPLGLNEFRMTKGRIIHNPKVCLIENNGQIELIDGTHRLIALALSGETEVTAYIGRKVKLDGKSMVGDSVFVLLRRLMYVQEEKDRAVVLETVAKLALLGRDGIDALKNYWVDHVKDEKERKLAEELIKRLTAGTN